nr:SEC-C domain-containing protein [Bacteroidota bacterium]
RDDIFDMLQDVVTKIVQKYYGEGDIEGLQQEVRSKFLINLDITPDQFQSFGEKGLIEEIVHRAQEFYHRKEEQLGSEIMGQIEKMVMLQVIDTKWRDHLRELDDLKEGIHLRGYGQKDPLVEYKTEAFSMFVELMEMISNEVLELVFKLYPERQEQLPPLQQRRAPRRGQLMYQHESALGAGLQPNHAPVPGEAQQAAGSPTKVQTVHVPKKVGRNEPCPCGSGKKYKNCHGA